MGQTARGINNNLDIDWSSYNEELKKYDFSFQEEDFKNFEEIMKGNLNSDQLFKIYKSKKPLFIFLIKLGYCCQMFDLDETPFVTSNNFASMIIHFLIRIPGRKNCPPKTFFKIKPELLMTHLEELIGSFFSNDTYKFFAFLATLPIFYLYLLKFNYIEMKKR